MVRVLKAWSACDAPSVEGALSPPDCEGPFHPLLVRLGATATLRVWKAWSARGAASVEGDLAPSPCMEPKRRLLKRSVGAASV